MSELVQRWKSVVTRIEQVSAEVNRSPARLIAISKTKPIEDIIELYQAGQRDFGENYVDELEKKSNDETIRSQCPEIRWHFVGHLQSNKVNRVLTRVPNLECIQTVDSLELANRLNNNLQQQAKKVNILLQINTSREAQKSGIHQENFLTLYDHIRTQCLNLVCQGLMTIGSLDNVNNDDDFDFQVLVQCRQMVAEKYQCPIESIELSMGMSHDYERAIRSGSTIVRVGSSIFGARH